MSLFFFLNLKWVGEELELLGNILGLQIDCSDGYRRIVCSQL